MFSRECPCYVCIYQKHLNTQIICKVQSNNQWLNCLKKNKWGERSPLLPSAFLSLLFSSPYPSPAAKWSPKNQLRGLRSAVSSPGGVRGKAMSTGAF